MVRAGGNPFYDKADKIYHVFTVEMTNGCIINDYITNSYFPLPSSTPLRPLCLSLRHKSCIVTQRHSHTHSSTQSKDIYAVVCPLMPSAFRVQADRARGVE